MQRQRFIYNAKNRKQQINTNKVQPSHPRILSKQKEYNFLQSRKIEL